MPVANPFGPAGAMNGYADTTAVIAPESGFRVGTGRLSAEHNCPLHIAVLIITALAVVFVLKALGFRFAVDASVGRGS